MISRPNDEYSLILFREDPVTWGQMFDELIDSFIFGKSEWHDNHPRATFQLIPAAKPIVIGLMLAFCSWATANGVFLLLSYSSKETQILPCVLIALISIYFLNFIFEPMDLDAPVMSTPPWWLVLTLSKPRVLHAFLVFYTLLSLLWMGERSHGSPLALWDWSLVTKKLSSSTSLTWVVAIFGAIITNYYHQRKIWSERWDSCANLYLEMCKEWCPERRMELRALVFQELVRRVMWGHPRFSTFVKEFLEDLESPGFGIIPEGGLDKRLTRREVLEWSRKYIDKLESDRRSNSPALHAEMGKKTASNESVNGNSRVRKGRKRVSERRPRKVASLRERSS